MIERETLKEILQEHVRIYPCMRPQDVVVLVYELVYGPQNLTLPSGHSTSAFVVPMGPYVRLNVEKARNHFSDEVLVDFLKRTMRTNKGSMTDHMAMLKAVKTMDDVSYPFSFDELLSYLSYYRGLAYPPVKHSLEFMNAYGDGYVIVRKDIPELEKFIV